MFQGERESSPGSVVLAWCLLGSTGQGSGEKGPRLRAPGRGNGEGSAWPSSGSYGGPWAAPAVVVTETGERLSHPLHGERGKEETKAELQWWPIIYL